MLLYLRRGDNVKRKISTNGHVCVANCHGKQPNWPGVEQQAQIVKALLDGRVAKEQAIDLVAEHAGTEENGQRQLYRRSTIINCYRFNYRFFLFIVFNYF